MGNFNYNSLVSTLLHRPLSSEKFVLYPKVAGYSGEDMTEAERSAKYQAESQNTYNSPTNIRAVAITGNGVTVAYHRSMVVKGETSGHGIVLKTFKGIDGINKSVFDILTQKVTYNQKLQEYNMEKQINSNAKKPERVELKGNLIGVFSSPYVCSNIEEIYFDWTAMVCEEAAPYFPEFANDNAIANFLNKQEQPGVFSTGRLSDFFRAFNSGGVKELRKRFPRLKVVAMISRLDDIMTATRSLTHPTLMFHSSENIRASAAKHYSAKTWIESNMDIIEANGGLCLVSTFAGVMFEANPNFVVKDNQYKFDKLVLKAAVDRYAHNVKRLLQLRSNNFEEDTTTKQEQEHGQNKAEEAPKGPEVVTDEIEKILVTVAEENGDEAVKVVLLSATHGENITTIKNMFSSFTSTNRTRFSSLIGFKL